MSIVWAALRCIILLLAALLSGTALAKAETVPEAVLTVANRDIATLRMTMLGASPELPGQARPRTAPANGRKGTVQADHAFRHLTIEGNKGGRLFDR